MVVAVRVWGGGEAGTEVWAVFFRGGTCFSSFSNFFAAFMLLGRAGVGCKCMEVTATVPRMGMTSYGCGTRRVRDLVVRTRKGNIRVVYFPRLYVATCAYNSLFARRVLLSRTRVDLVGVLGFDHALSVVSVVKLPISCGNVLLGYTTIVRGKGVLKLVPGARLPGRGRIYRRH